MTHFRKRFDPDFINEINEHIVQKHQESESAKNDSSGDDDGTPPSSDSTSNSKPNQESKKGHQGKLLLDATCAPSDIAYPTAVGLLNEAREKLEKIIDTLHIPFIGKRRTPRPYTINTRKKYVSWSKH